MQNKKKKFVKQEKGSISTLVLFTVLVFLAILGGSYFITTALLKSQLKSNLKIQQIYGQEVEKVDEIYKQQTEVCRIGETSYETLQEAINVVSDKNEKIIISITKDFTESNLITIPEGKNIELLLNGKSLTGQIKNQGDLSITGEGTIKSETTTTIINYGNCKIDKAVIAAKLSSCAAFLQYEGGNLTLKSGEIKNLAEALVADSHRAQALEVYGGTVVLSEGIISSICGRAIGNHGTIELCGATITSNSSETIYHNIFATVCNFNEDALPAGIFKMTAGNIINTGGGYAVSNTAGASNFTKTGGNIEGATSGI